MPGTRFTIEVRPSVPDELSRLPELAGNLAYTWDRDLRGLFRALDEDLYLSIGANLKLFLRRVSQSALSDAVQNPEFMQAYRRVLAMYDVYRQRRLPPELAQRIDPDKDLIAYFCFEFGFHDSLPWYAGGLGILAADHLKAASDLALPVVGVGLLYQQGYFEQTIDAQGRQIEHYSMVDIDALPLRLVRDDRGAELRVSVPMGGGDVAARLWRADVGNICLYLLDTDLAENGARRSITHRLYGGDSVMRIQQEMLLGIGGVRALRAMGLAPTVWHLNEGHAALQILERYRELLERGHSFAATKEIVAAATVFTVHTPVPAGHDVYADELLLEQLGPYLETLPLDAREVLALGRNGEQPRFHMTSLAIRGSRHHNGVSALHGRVASRNERYAWPEVPPEENPLTYITNAVHLETFLALEWVNEFTVRFTDWRDKLCDQDYWRCLDSIPDEAFARTRHELERQLLDGMAARLRRQHARNGMAESRIAELTAFTELSDVLVLGFARRFATYKRATMMFTDLERMAKLLNDPARPVLIFMAGKAHPGDDPGKRLIEHVHELSRRPEFAGKLHLVENYDLALARLLVSGVDVWVSTPEHPLEACSTSGMKAGLNGVINLSVLDGWWAEAYDGSNGWAISPHGTAWDAAYRAREEASDLMDLLERKVIPTYFEDPVRWTQMAKASMRTTIPRFNSERMVRDYIARLYAPTASHGARLNAEGGKRGAELAAWKSRVEAAWPGVSFKGRCAPPQQVADGETVELEVEVDLAGLAAEDVKVECIVENGAEGGTQKQILELACAAEAGPAMRFRLEFAPPFPGIQSFRIRMYPYHPLLSHPFEVGRMRWL